MLPSLPHANRRLLERVALQHGVRLNVATEVDGVALVKELVNRGFGSTVVTYAGVAAEVERCELTAIPIDRPQIVSTHLHWCPAREQHAMAHERTDLHCAEVRCGRCGIRTMARCPCGWTPSSQ